MTKVKELVRELESFAPSALKEDFDNVGLLVGDFEQEISSVLITLDITEGVIDEAIERSCNVVVAHHPIMLSGVKRIIGNNDTERVLLKAIKNDIAIYASHTNIDSVMDGVSGRMCKKLNLKQCKILAPKKDNLVKLVTFVPSNELEKVRAAIFDAGAGVIGNYDCCSYSSSGKGSFRAGTESKPFVGDLGQLHEEEEVRLETILPTYLQGKVLSALKTAHPYEEVAYDIYPIKNEWPSVGLGMVGELEEEVEPLMFLKSVKEIFNAGVVKHTKILDKPIKRVAVCGGSGSFLLNKALASKADVFITGDFKYHQFFDAEGRIIVADIGHFESEQFTKEVFFELLTKKFSNFAVHLSNVNSNPVNYI